MAAKSAQITVSLSELKVGMVLPADVADARNATVLLLGKGIPVTEQLLNRLKDRGVSRVSVDEESAAIIRNQSTPRKPAPAPKPVKETQAPKLRDRRQQPVSRLPARSLAQQVMTRKQQHSANLQAVFSTAQKNSTPSGALAREIISDSVENIMSDIDVFLKVALENSESSELHEHCLAAAQLAMSVGLMEGLDQQAIQDLGAGCVMSRIGQSDAATHYAEQMRELSQTELVDIKRTPSRTFDFMQKMRDMTVGARNVAYQIFERFDGSGYPRGRCGNQITPLARIAAVCDVYVALTSPRPHRPAYEPYAAVEQLLQETRKGRFDPLALRGLLKTIGLFPIGSFVRLSDGSVGQVSRNHHDCYDRPLVHLFIDAAGNCVRDNEITLDLETRPELNIASAVASELIQELMIQSVVGNGSESEKSDPQLCLAFED